MKTVDEIMEIVANYGVAIIEDGSNMDEYFIEIHTALDEMQAEIDKHKALKEAAMEIIEAVHDYTCESSGIRYAFIKVDDIQPEIDKLKSLIEEKR